MGSDLKLKEIEFHGHRVAYRSAGSGPMIVLVHGITSTPETWDRVTRSVPGTRPVDSALLTPHRGPAGLQQLEFGRRLSARH